MLLVKPYAPRQTIARSFDPILIAPLFLPLSSPSFAVVRLRSDSFFNLADDALDFAGILLNHAIPFEFRIVREFADLLLHCAFQFVKLAYRLILHAGFYHDSLLCSVMGFGSLRSIEISLRLNYVP
jgi:hypothetical protein